MQQMHRKIIYQLFLFHSLSLSFIFSSDDKKRIDEIDFQFVQNVINQMDVVNKYKFELL